MLIWIVYIYIYVCISICRVCILCMWWFLSILSSVNTRTRLKLPGIRDLPQPTDTTAFGCTLFRNGWATIKGVTARCVEGAAPQGLASHERRCLKHFCWNRPSKSRLLRCVQPGFGGNVRFSTMLGCWPRRCSSLAEMSSQSRDKAGSMPGQECNSRAMPCSGADQTASCETTNCPNGLCLGERLGFQAKLAHYRRQQIHQGQITRGTPAPPFVKLVGHAQDASEQVYEQHLYLQLHGIHHYH